MMRKGVFKRLWALIRGRVICRIYDGEGIVHECFNLLEACRVLDRFRAATPNVEYRIKLEEA